ncbi:hypothetical protein DUI87_24298 [Hirundo rustica rustica]|uniref:Core shell protein Gag P30 domain-containing protein n=1 Tax=Hirundo rustica rustica TaxID=333673 RepID=A0A3M0JFM6_HIRRU|nr:hypothetical protein DUI87_24298 [Hirundo rustica rustica]
MGEPVIHECLEAIEATCSSCLDLKDTLLENTETWSTDGSSCVISGRHAGKGVAEKSGDAQQSLVPVLQEKEKEVKQDEVKLQKQVDPGKDEAAMKLQTQQSIPVSDKTQVPGAREFLATDWTEIRKHALKGETLQMGSRSVAMPVTYDTQDANPRWEQLDHEVVKDLMKAIRDNGLGSPYFKQLLQTTFKRDI